MNGGLDSGGHHDRRPRQAGALAGVNGHGARVLATVEWLIDTGAEISAVQARYGRPFVTRTTALTASATTGGTAIRVVDGLEVEVAVGGSGGRSSRRVARPVGIKSDDAGSNLVGMDAVAAVRATVIWGPLHQTGVLWDEHEDVVPPRSWITDHHEDARALIAYVRALLGTRSVATDPVDDLREAFARHEEEADLLLAGFVGRREAVAISLGGTDLWNATNAGAHPYPREVERIAVAKAAFDRIEQRLDSLPAGDVRDRLIAWLRIDRHNWGVRGIA